MHTQEGRLSPSATQPVFANDRKSFTALIKVTTDFLISAKNTEKQPTWYMLPNNVTYVTKPITNYCK